MGCPVKHHIIKLRIIVCDSKRQLTLLQKPGGEVSGLVTTAETMADAAREEAVQETAAAPEAADFPTD